MLLYLFKSTLNADALELKIAQMGDNFFFFSSLFSLEPSFFYHLLFWTRVSSCSSNSCIFWFFQLCRFFESLLNLFLKKTASLENHLIILLFKDS